MNLEQVSHYIAHPHELGLHEAPALKELSEKHPYAAVFSLLYLTALANGKSVDLDSALQQHAYRLSDRTQLYHLVNGAVGTNEPTVSSFAGEPRERIEEPLVAEEPAAREEAVLPEAAAEAPVHEEPVPETPVSDESFIEAASSFPVEEQQPEPETEPTPFDLVTEAFTREQHFDISFGEPEPTNADTHSASGTDELHTAEEPAVQDEAIAPEEQTEKKAAEPSAAEPPKETVRPFTSWLKSGSGQQPAGRTEEKTVPVPPEKKRAEDIIDTFIREEPTITRSKTEFFSPSRKAKESLDEDAVPVSETLAKIYAAQGNYPKAIHVYHQLMLSFPEKKSLFAVQIEALKKKITA